MSIWFCFNCASFQGWCHLVHKFGMMAFMGWATRT
ncbi:unnamed protein product [Pylaiella littoralis]